MPNVYDDEKQKTVDDHDGKIDAPGSHDDLGVHPERREAEAADLQKSFDAPAISDAERQASQQPAHDKASDAESDKLGKGYTDPEGKSSKKKKFFTRKRATAGIVSLFVAGGGFGVFSILQGPLQIVHVGQMLRGFHFSSDEDFMDNRAGKIIKHMRTAKAHERRNMGYIGNKIADHYTVKLKEAGITPEYDNTRSIKAYTIDTSKPKGREALNQLRSQGLDVDSLPRNGDIIRVDLQTSGKGSTKARRLAVKGMVNTLHLGKVSSVMGSRVLKIRAGVDFHPFKNMKRRVGESIGAYYKRVQEARSKSIKNGVDPRVGRTVATEAGTDADGNPIDPDGDTNQASGELKDALGEVDQDASVKERSSAIKAKVLGGGLGVTGLLSLVCGVQQLGEAAGDLRHAQVVLPLIRLGMSIITGGSQVEGGADTNLEEVGAVSETLYDPKTGTHAVDAASIQHNNGQEVTGPDIPEGSHPAGDIKGGGFFGTIDNVVNAIPGGGTICSAITSTIGGWILTGAGVLLSATGVGAVINIIVEGATQIAAEAFLDDIIAWLAGDQVDVEGARGALVGSYADYGAFLASNDSAMAHGGAAMSATSAAILKGEQMELQRIQNEQKPALARYFDLYDVNSVASKVAMQTYTVNTSSVASVATTTLSIPQTLASTLQGIFTPKASAAATFDYGIQKVGFTAEERDDPRYENPFVNADRVEPNLAELNAEYGTPCFGATVDPETFRYTAVPAPRYDELEDKCKDRNNQELKDYRFYLADMQTSLSIACYENLDETNSACAEIGLENTVIGGSAEAVGDQPPAGTSGFGWPVKLADWPKRSQPVAECGLRYSNGTVHTGIDISVPTGTPIYAAASGKISMITGAYGAVNIETNEKDSSGKTLYVNYQHLSKTSVKLGQTVSKGQQIGLSGSTGTASPHLHFSIWTTNKFLGGHMSPSSSEGQAVIAQMKQPMDYMPLDEDNRNISECSR